jgi:hypothetical protein
MRNSSTLVYLAIALGLFCYLMFVDKRIPGTNEKALADAQLFQLNPDDVTGLEITNVHGFFFFQKTNDHWEIREPVQTLADSATIDSIINQIAFAQPERVIEVDGSSQKDADSLKEWGLNPAAERIVIHTPTKAFELLIGRKMAINDSVYARASGKKNEPVRILPSTIKDVVEKDLSDLRSRNVFDFDVTKVSKLASHIADTATTPGQQYEIDSKDGKWTMQLPLVARASDADMQALLAKVLGLRVVDFVSDSASNLSTYGLTSPTVTLSVTIGTDEPLVLQIGGPVPDKPDQVYAQRLKSNSVFTITKASLDDVLKSIPNVRDRHVLPFDANKPTDLSWTVGTKSGNLHFANGVWNTLGDQGFADVGKVNDILVKLSELETTPVLNDSATDLKPFGLDKPLGKITIQSPEFKPSGTATLFIGKTQNKLIYVRNSTEPFVYTLPDNALDFLPASNLMLRDARAINLQQDKVTGMTITVASGPTITLARSSGGTWSAVNVKDRMVDSLKADAQASLLCQLQAKAWLGPVIPSYGLSKPILTISVAANLAQPTTLHIGATLPDGGHAAVVDGQPTAFELSEGDYGILNASTLQPIPKELLQTNAPSAVAPSTNAAPTTNAAPASK